VSTATEITKLRIDASMALHILATAVAVAVTFTTLQGQVGSVSTEIATLRGTVERLSDFRERTVVLETRFASIDDRLARIEIALDGLTQRRAALDTPPPARSIKR
jgi:hypothetical protein